MPLSTFFQRFRRQAANGPDTAPLSSQDVEAMRSRARRRLIGMAVLVLAGVVGFPWLFETQPRPMAGDIQIVQAGNDANGELQITGGQAPAKPSRAVTGRVAVSGIVPPTEQSESPEMPGAGASMSEAPATPEAPKETKAEAKPEVKPEAHPVAKVAQASPQVQRQLDRPADKAGDKPVPDKKAMDKKVADKSMAKPAAKEPVKEQPKVAAKEAKPADKDAKPADKDKAATATRYVVQFGAFADANTAHDARMKVERLGLKTYTQQVDTPAGKRIRVRMGPYADKAEADKAMATLRKAGLSGAVLTL